MPLTFASLPSELLVEILFYLDWRSLLNVQRANTRMYTIIHGEKILQYKIELDLSGMTYSGSPDSISTSAEERLKWLKNHQSNWFRFRSDSKELMDFGDDFIGDRGDFLSVISGDIVAFGISNLQTSTTSLAFRNLREPAKNIHGVNSKLSFEFFTRELAVDPSQDLVILISEGGPLRPTNGMKVTINIHIRNISTGTYHGMANHDTLVHVLSCSSILWYRYSISIWHQFVGVHCQRIVDDEQSFEFSELLVWDWKTGQKEMHLIDLIASFTFLSDYHVLLALPAIPDTSLSQTPMLVVIDFHKTSTNFTTVLGFSLPEFRRTAHISTLRFHAEVPRVGSSASEQTILNHHHTASNNRVILLSVQVFVNEFEVPVLTFCIPASTIASFLENAFWSRVSCIQGCTQSAIPWDAWGKHGTRMLKIPGAFPWCSHAYGSRCTFSMRVHNRVTRETSNHIVVGDFNRWLIRRFVHREFQHSLRSIKPDANKDSDAIPHVFTAPTTLEGPMVGRPVFTKPVVTTLPFTMVVGEKLNNERDVPILADAHLVVMHSDCAGRYTVYGF